MEMESWRRNFEEKSWRRNHGGRIMEESWRSNHGGDICKDLRIIWEPSGSYLGAIWELSGSYLKAIWEAPGKHLAIIREALWSYLGTIWETFGGSGAEEASGGQISYYVRHSHTEWPESYSEKPCNANQHF